MPTATNAEARAGTGRRIALVIGVNEAPSSLLSPLKHSVADAEAMAEVLQQCCHFELLEPPIVGAEATSDRVKKAVRRLARQRADEDFLLLYFSGHGQPMTVEADQPDVYLVTSDFDEVDVQEDEDAHFSLRWLSEKLYKATEAGRVLVILDCCYAGDIGRIGPDPYWEEIQARINKYLGAPSAESGVRSGGLRLALTATGHNETAAEGDGHGLMTGLLLPALHGEVDAVLEVEQHGQVSLQRVHRYLELTMPPGQQPSLSGDFAGRSCILTSHPERAEQLRPRPSHPLGADRPRNYIPFPRNPLFQPRPGEFERLEHLLFGQGGQQQPRRIGLIGMVGMGGVGKTQLAVQLAYRYEERFPAGVFWMAATGANLFEWQRQFAELAFKTDYLPPDDDVSSPENEMRRARHLARYLARHANALLILDNVEDPTLVMSVLPELAGGEVKCTILYTSRNRFLPPGVTSHPVEQLSEEGALYLLLATTRPSLLSKVLSGSQDAETWAAHVVCQEVGYLPLALVHLRGVLARDQQLTLVRLAKVLRQRGTLDTTKMHSGDAASLFETFRLSWEKVRDEGAQQLFKLASYFPEAAPIPLWLLGLAAGLGESGDIFEPLGEACIQLQEVSLVEELSGQQARLHPLVREFGRQLVAEEGEKGRTLLEAAGERLAAAFVHLETLERRAQQEGYWACLEQVRAAYEYARLLGTTRAEQLGWIERWLGRESYLLGSEQWWQERLPVFFSQQLFNRSVEAGHPLIAKETPSRWLRQENQVGAEDQALLRVFAGHTDSVYSVAFSHDGRWMLTGSYDRTARLWESSSGKLLQTLQGHTDSVYSVAFSPDGHIITTCDSNGRVFFWRASGLAIGQLLGMYVATYEVKAIYWQDSAHVVLADIGGPDGYPHIYRLKLEGRW